MSFPRRIFLAALAAAATALAAGPAAAQPHEATRGAYTLRASVVRSTDISAAAAREHGIRPSPRRGVLNVTLLRRAGERRAAVPARVEARVRDAVGRPQDVRLREVRAGGRVSYVSGFALQPGQVLDFSISARPADAGAGAERIALRFRERMPAR